MILDQPRPRFAEAVDGKGWNLQSAHTFDEMQPDVGRATALGSELWGGIFWEIRELLGQSVADKLLFETWFQFRPEEVVEHGSAAFARKLVARIERLENGRHTAQVKAVFERRKLPL